MSSARSERGRRPTAPLLRAPQALRHTIGSAVSLFVSRIASSSPDGLRPRIGRLLLVLPCHAILCLEILCAAAMSAPASAESRVLLPAAELEPVAATTFDADGQPIGRSRFTVETEGSGLLRMKVEISVEGGGMSRSEALLAPVAATAGGSRPEEGPRRWRLLEERSQATRADGRSLDRLVIDHSRGRVSCHPSSADGVERPPKHLDLPADERVVNVPLQLLFLPLVAREVEDVRFQITLCRDGPVIHDMIAVRGPSRQRDGRSVIEVRYGPDLGRAVAWLASRMLPSFSFWFDRETGAYLAHRMPLHTKGPEVLLVRTGLAPRDIGQP